MGISIQRKSRSVSGSMPNNMLEAEQLVKSAISLLERRITHAPGQGRKGLFPCNRLSLTASNFPSEVTTDPEKAGGTITKFFQAAPPGTSLMDLTPQTVMSQRGKGEKRIQQEVKKGTLFAHFSSQAAVKQSDTTVKETVDLISEREETGVEESATELEDEECYADGHWCPKCGKAIAAAEEQEHRDYHVALALQQTLRREATAPPAKAPAPRPKTIASYFTKPKGT